MIVLTLPFPPSANMYYRSVNKGPAAGRVLISEPGRKYRHTVAGELLAQIGRPPHLTGRLAVRLELNVPDLRRRDVKNHDKGLLDALTHAGLWIDDEQIDWFLVSRGRLIRGGRCVLQVLEIKPGCEQAELLLEDEALPF